LNTLDEEDEKNSDLDYSTLYHESDYAR
jgi:hypothetical protein